MFNVSLCSKEVIIAIQDFLFESKRTIDITAEELAQNYDIQIKAKLTTAVLINPDVRYVDPTPPSEQRKYLASYLSSLSSKEKADTVYEYIKNK